MVALIWAIVGMGLVAAMLYGGMSYFQGVSPARAQIKDTTITAFHALAAAYQAYINANTVAPTAAAWQTQLIPDYIPELKYPVTGMTWSYGADATAQCSGLSCGNYFCLSGSVSKAAYSAFLDATGSFPTGAYIIGTCGSRLTVSIAGGAAWPQTVSVNYWLQGS